MSQPILPGATLGVLGSGQLGRMFAQAAQRMGYAVHVYSPDANSPAGQVAHREFVGAYDDAERLREFAKTVDVVTFEFENIPTAELGVIEEHVPLRPNARLLEATQERLREKTALAKLGLPVAPHAAIETPEDLAGAAASVGLPGILKTSAFGYDGKGQRRANDAAGLERAWEDLDRQRCVLERLIPFEFEISVVGARGTGGELALYDPFQNDHANHILDVTFAPAKIAPATRDAAHEIARGVLEGFDVVGVLCVEMFLLKDGSLILNEVAPRTHNSGHITLDGHETSQFEQQVRAICGLPLGPVGLRRGGAAMANLLGENWQAGEPNWKAALEDQDVRLHLYGKSEARAGRKMGHLNACGLTADAARASVKAARARLT